MGDEKQEVAAGEQAAGEAWGAMSKTGVGAGGRRTRVVHHALCAKEAI